MLVTNFLLIVIILLLVGRMIINIYNGRRGFKQTYATATDIQTHYRITDSKELHRLNIILIEESRDGFELVQILEQENGYLLLFTKKKIRSYFDD